MDDTHTAAEEDEGEEGHIPHTQSPPITHSLTHNLALDQGGRPVLVKRESGLELTGFALHQHVCSSVTFQNGSAGNLTKPNGANMTTLSLPSPERSVSVGDGGTMEVISLISVLPLWLVILLMFISEKSHGLCLAASAPSLCHLLSAGLSLFSPSYFISTQLCHLHAAVSLLHAQKT